jgi:hypothetical protein
MRLLELPQERATATTDQQNARAHGNHRNGNTCDAQFKFWSEKNVMFLRCFFQRLETWSKVERKRKSPFETDATPKLEVTHPHTYLWLSMYLSLYIYIWDIYVFISSRLVNCRILWTHICGTPSQSPWTSPEQRDAPHWKSGQVQLKNLRQNPVKPPEVRGPQTSCMKFFEYLIYIDILEYCLSVCLEYFFGSWFKFSILFDFFDVSTLEYYVRIFLVNLFFYSFIYATEKRCCQQAAGVFLSVFNSSPNDQHILVHSFPFQAACHPNTLRWSYGLWLCFCVSRVFLRARKLLYIYIHTGFPGAKHTHIVVPNLTV